LQELAALQQQLADKQALQAKKDQASSAQQVYGQ
jgi:hypothetical protein